MRSRTNNIAVTAVHVVDVVAVLALEFRIGVVESQAVAAHLQLGASVLALPVLVARAVVSEEAVILRAIERRRNCEHTKQSVIAFFCVLLHDSFLGESTTSE